MVPLLSCSCIPLHDYYLVTTTRSQPIPVAQIQEASLSARLGLVGTASGASLVMEFVNNSEFPVRINLKDISLDDAKHRFLATRLVEDRFFADPEPTNIESIPAEALVIPGRQRGAASRKALKLYFPMQQPILFPLVKRYTSFTAVIPNIEFQEHEKRVTWTIPFRW